LKPVRLLHVIILSHLTRSSVIQGSVFYLSFWYRYEELALRGCIIYSTSALAGSLNGLIAYDVVRTLDGHNGWSAWRWIFLIEGIVPIAWSFIVFIFLPPTPETTRFPIRFTPSEQSVLIARSRAAHNTGESKIIPKFILKLLKQPQFIMLALIDCGGHFCVSSLSNFLPDILFGLGYDEKEAQIMSVIVYACAFVSLLLSGYLSDRFHRRGLAIIINCLIAAVGYILLLSVTNQKIRFFAACLVAMGTFPITVLSLVWTALNNVGYTYRASAAALINVIAQCISISANQAYADPPYYRKGLGASLGMVCVSGAVSVLLCLWVRRANGKKIREREGEEARRLREESVDILGCKHPDFMFSY
jgi:sugar phosphate permease